MTIRKKQRVSTSRGEVVPTVLRQSTEMEKITGVVLTVLKEKANKSRTGTRTTKYSTTVVKLAVARLSKPTYRKPVLGVLVTVLKYGRRKTKVHARIGLK
jgi:hypothetical protein